MIFLNVAHSGMAMSTMMHPYESYYLDIKYTCMSLSFNNDVEKFEF